MKVLLIGGTGLISTAITQFLLERGDAVTHYNRGKRRPVPEGVTQIVGDRTDYPRFEAQMAEAGTFDCVMDMVCYQPEDADSLLRACVGRTAHLIVCSTVDVHAKPAFRYPIREDEPFGPPPWDYAQKKAVIETTLQQARERIPITVLRPAYTYGEGSGLLHSFGGRTTYLDRIRKGKPIVVHGDGSSFWVACHRDDVARAFVNAAGKSVTFGKSYIVPGEEWMTWNRYHEIVAEAMGAPKPTLVHIPTDLLAKAVPKRAFIDAVNFQFNNIFDTTAARADLGFRYTIPFREGVRRIVAWLDARGGPENSNDDPFDDQVISAWQRLSAGMEEELSVLS